MTVAGITFHSPVWIYLTPFILIGLALLFAYASRMRKKQITEFASERLLGKLLPHFSPQRYRAKQILVFLGVIFLLLSLARPQFGYEWRETRSRGIDIIFAFDVSRSMLAEDIRPNRLQRAKLDVLDFVRKLEGDRIGLVVFAGDAFLMCPLTLDYNAFRQSLMAADTHTISMGGTDIAKAIRESEAAFGKNNNYKIIVLISDGEDLGEEGVRQAKQAARDGVVIYTVGVGDAEGSLIPIIGPHGNREYLRDDDGELVRSRLDETTLQEIAEVTNGFYVPLGSTGRGIEQVYEAGLKSIPKQELSSKLERTPLERFQIPLTAALVFLALEPLLGTRKRLGKARQAKQAGPIKRFAEKQHAHVAILAGTFAFISLLTPDSAQASTLDPLEARQHYNRGIDHYRNEDYANAEKAFSQALNSTDLKLTSNAFYNLGNTHSQLGRVALTEVPSSTEQESRFNQAHDVAGQALQHGNALLERAGPNRIPKALRTPEVEAQVIPQDEIKQAIQIAEQAKSGLDELQESSQPWGEQQQSALNSWEKALNHYKSALELAPEGEDARRNNEQMQQHRNELQRRHQRLQQLQAKSETQQDELEQLIEELKKLLEDEQNENQDNQNDQQQGQNNQDNQNSQDSQDSQNNQNNQSDQNDQNDHNSRDQSGENSENRDNQDPQEGDQNQENQNQDNPGENNDQQNESGQPSELQGEDSNEVNEQEEGSSEQEPTPAGAEQAEAAENEGKGFVASEEMTQEEARQLLDSFRGNEKKLPITGYSRRPHMQDAQGKRKDW